MAVKTLYVLEGNVISPDFISDMQDSGTAPSAVNTSYNFKPAKVSTSTPFFASSLGGTKSSTTGTASSVIDSSSGPSTGTGVTTGGDSFREGPFTGTFANTAWTFNLNLRASTAGAVGRLRCRVWKSANSNGSSATALTVSTLLLPSGTLTLSTTADVNATATWSPGALTFSNEYIFFQLEWQETTTGSSNNNDVRFRQGTASITTPDFAAVTTVSGTASATGVGTASAQPLVTEAAEADANAVGTALATSSVIATTEADANAAGTASAEGAAVVPATASAIGVGIASATGAVVTAAVASATGVGTALGAGPSLFAALATNEAWTPAAPILLLHCDGPDASTVFIDESSHTVTPVGNAQVDTDQSVFGGASAMFQAPTDYLQLDGSSDFA